MTDLGALDDQARLIADRLIEGMNGDLDRTLILCVLIRAAVMRRKRNVKRESLKLAVSKT